MRVSEGSLCKSVLSWARIFISFPFPWRSFSLFFFSFSFIFFPPGSSVGEEGLGCVLRQPPILGRISLGLRLCLGLGQGGCFLLNCPICFGKQKLHCFENYADGFLRVPIPQLLGGFN